MQFLRKFSRAEIIRIHQRFFPDLDETTLGAAICLFGLSRELTSTHERMMVCHGLSRGRFALLMFLHVMGEEGATPSGAAENIGIKPASVTGLIDGLEKEGLVERNPDPDDRRRTMITITPGGGEYLKEILPLHMGKIKALFKGFTTEEKELLVTLLDKIRASNSEMDMP